MSCGYCFYKAQSKERQIENCGRMSDLILENLVKTIFEANPSAVNVAFQGGEPTLIGLNYYQKSVELIRQYNVWDVPISYSIQTNGIALNEIWAEFFLKHGFLVGISLDGTEKVHDFYRKHHEGAGTFVHVIRAIEILRKYGVLFNVLSVVTDISISAIKEIYDTFKQNGFEYVQFIPCLEPVYKLAETQENRFLTDDAYGGFLVDLFDLWLEDFIRGHRLNIRFFENFAMILAGYEAEDCSMKGQCSASLIVESDGSVYPCDFYTIDKWRLGKVGVDSMALLLNNDVAKAFVERSMRMPIECLDCEFKAYCRGGCYRHRSHHKNRFCNSYKVFYTHAVPKMKRLLESMNSL